MKTRIDLTKILAGVLIVALPVIMLISDRDWVLSDQHRAAAHVSDIPETASGELVSELDRIVSYDGVHVPNKPPKAVQFYRLMVLAGRAPQVTENYVAPRPRYGYSIREWSFLGMPFGWYSEYGYVVYTRDKHQLVMAPLIAAADAQLHKESGRDLRQGFVFPFWAHAWGWLYVAGLALWGWLYHRGVLRRRAEEGMI